ncbi:MAG: hydroxymethylbilane synthase [Candidatus Promineifilaceae bacterium]
MKLRIGTRKSQLALWQAHNIKSLLEVAWPELTCDIVHFVTEGDKSQASGKPLPEIGGKGLFTLELERSLHSAEIDIAVHSLKDLPVEQPAGLTLGAIPARGTAEDALIAKHDYKIGTLPFGATVGTSSLRRQAQLLAMRPDLNVQSIRGNVPTRIQKMLDGQYHAIVLARVGVERLGITEHLRQILPVDVMLPAPGQGALGIQCRADDTATLNLLAAIDDEETRNCVSAERAFLNGLGAGCSLPVGAFATWNANKSRPLQLEGVVGSVDGKQLIEVGTRGSDPFELGAALAQTALDRGAAALLSNG